MKQQVGSKAGWGTDGEGTRKPSEVMEMFCILLWMVLTHVYTYRKTHNLHSTFKDLWTLDFPGGAVKN